MKKKINIVLYKTLLETEFSMVSNNLKKKTNNFNLATLDLLELIKNLKQLIRILQFSNEQEKKKIILCSSNKIVLNFLHLYSNELLLNKYIMLNSDFTRITPNLKLTRPLLILEEPLKNNVGILAKLLEKNISIISKINSKKELKNFGSYKIYNDMLNYKKLAFIMTLFHQIFQKKS